MYFNPSEAGIGRIDHQIVPLEVAVTTGSTTIVVSTVSYHLISLSSDRVFGNLILGSWEQTFRAFAQKVYP